MKTEKAKKTKNIKARTAGKKPKKVRTPLDGKKVKGVINSYLLILLSNIIRAFAVQYFILPNSFAPGGITGIAAILHYYFGNINTGIFLIVLNIPIIILAFIFYNRSYALKTMIGLVLNSAFLLGLEQFDIFCTNLWGTNLVEILAVGDQTILAAIAGGAFSGIGLALIMRSGGSNGGTEVIGGILQRKLPTVNMSWFVSILDSTVIIASFFVYTNGLAAVLLALVQTFTSSKVCDIIITGAKTAIKIEVITKHPEKVGEELIRAVGRGVTIINATGLYSKEERSLLICIVRKRELPEFYKILKNHPDAFSYITSTNEVLGQGFSKPLLKTEQGTAPKIEYVNRNAHPEIKETAKIIEANSQAEGLVVDVTATDTDKTEVGSANNESTKENDNDGSVSSGVDNKE